MKWQKTYQKAVTFSYDDGNQQDIRLVEMMNAYGLKGTFHVNTGLDAVRGTWLYENRLAVHRLDPASFSTVYQGHELSVHGSTHQNLTSLTPEALDKELRDNIDEIERLWGRRPVTMSYPYGAHQETVREKLRELGIRCGRTVQSSHSFAPQTDLLCFHPTCHHDDPALFSLAEQFLQSEDEFPQIFCVWGHSYEFDGKENWQHIQRFFQYISGRPDVFYGTMEEILCDQDGEI